jgi:hypothetical protein
VIKETPLLLRKLLSAPERQCCPQAIFKKAIKPILNPEPVAELGKIMQASPRK